MLLLTLLLFPQPLPAVEYPNIIPYSEARVKAEKENRPMMVIVTVNGCVFCERLKIEASRLKDGGRRKDLLITTINLSEKPEYKTYFPEVKLFPTTYLYDGKGKKKHVFEGYVSEVRLQTLVRTYLGVQ